MRHRIETIGRESFNYPGNVEVALGRASPDQITCIGQTELLELPRIGLLCSGRLPGEAASRAYDLAQRLRAEGRCVVSGFHSPMERECLAVLLNSTCPIIVCPARGLGSFRVPIAWRPALEACRLLVVSCFPLDMRRGAVREAVVRNRFVAALSDELAVAHAAAGGKVARIAREAVCWGRPVRQVWEAPRTTCSREPFRLQSG